MHCWVKIIIKELGRLLERCLKSQVNKWEIS
jgi:hypothetical protein